MSRERETGGTGSHFAGRGRLIAGVGLAAALVGLAVTCWPRRAAPPQEPPTRLLSDLILVDGRLYPRGNAQAPFSGWVVEHYVDGALKSRSQTVDGRLEGVSEGWHPNGQAQVREHFVAGVAEGPVTKWYPNGQVLSEGMARQGRLEGTFRRWHDNGQLAEEVTLHHGEPQGLSRAWFPNGQLKAEVLLEAGQVVRQQFWSEDSQPLPAPGANRTATP